MNRSGRRRVPSFFLYGQESSKAGRTDPLHVESIQSRSRKYLWQIATHRHVGLCQCVWVAAGPVTFELEGERAAYQGPIAFIIPAGAVHGFGFRANTQGHVLTSDLPRLLSLASTPQHSSIAAMFGSPRTLNLAYDPTLAARAVQLFDTLAGEFYQPDSLQAPVSAWLALAVLWFLAAECLPRLPGGRLGLHDLERLWRFRVLTEAHYADHWPVKRYAAELALSESSLNRLCRDLAGSSAFDIIQQRIGLEARRRLTYVADSVTMIAAELGFKDAAYFCRFFRRQTGMSPGTFRRRPTLTD